MPYFLGIDTSNYTTSVALYDSDARKVFHRKKLLSVKQGSIGLKQSDAVFAHIKQLPGLVSSLVEETGVFSLRAVGVSVRPRDVEGSYMPCFLTGNTAASCIASIQGIPKYEFSHQAGHIMAALFSVGKMEFLQREFLCFHVSGGTTECLHVHPLKNGVFDVSIVARSLDLKAGQAIDRVGVMLGLPFPAGKYLDELSQKSNRVFRIHPTMKGADCCLSGIENQCKKRMEQGEKPEDIARYCIESVRAAIEEMTRQAFLICGELPVVYAGGVMSNSNIREYMTKRYPAFFAKPEFSSDNAAGIALLTASMERGDGACP